MNLKRILVAAIALAASFAAHGAPLSIECSGTWAMSGSTATCTPSGTAPTTPTPPPAGGGGTTPTPPPASCPVVPSSNNMVLTAGTYAIPFTPANTNLRTISWSPHLGGGSWDYAISATPCDFASPVLAVNSTGKLQTYPAAGAGTNGYITVRHKGGVNVDVGRTYYFNIRGDSGGIIAGSAP